ncbi:tetratricopeptide repeat protein [Actinoallomurus sp. NPDC050550]|uniref:tetratricopeptide repeat protein n=1 Tax=Actinoallomurus sp. NPDC050550 TaxID=3154937 RepID=UPI0033FB5FF7
MSSSDTVREQQRTVAKTEKSLGPDHPATLEARNILAVRLHKAGRSEEARPLLQQTLAGRVRVLGADHPDTLQTRENLAIILRAVGRPEEAIPLLRGNLATHERMSGPGHEDAIFTRRRIAEAYEDLERFDDAVTEYEAIVAAVERTRPPGDPEILKAHNHLAVGYEDAERYEDARAMHERNLADRERAYGRDHPETFVARRNVAIGYVGEGRAAAAIPLFNEVAAYRARTLGPDHPDTLLVRRELAEAYDGAGDLTNALAMYQQVLADCERALGPDDPMAQGLRENFTDPSPAWWHRRPLSLHQLWLVSLSAILVERTFGGTHTSLYPLGWLSPRRARRMLDDSWDVSSREELLSNLEWLATSGHRTSFAPRLGHEPLAWDIARYANNVRYGVAAGFIDEPTAWHLLQRIVAQTASAYRSWREFADDFLTGRRMWMDGLRGTEDENWPTPHRRTVEAVGRLLDPSNAKSPWNHAPWDAMSRADPRV